MTETTADRGGRMLTTAIVLVALALVAAVLGYGGFTASVATIGKLALTVLMILAAVSFFLGRSRARETLQLPQDTAPPSASGPP